MNIISYFLIRVIKFYQRFISPLKKKKSCRFYPTCSTYAIKALKKHGVIKGGLMAVKRILKCHPFNPGGYDPVD